MLLLQEWMQAASFLTTVSGACISKHHSHIFPYPNSPFGIKWLTINVWWFSMFDDSEYHHSISRFEASESGKNNCRSSNTAPSEFAFRSLGGASNVPGKQGTVVPLKILFRHRLSPSANAKLLGLGVLSATFRQFAVGSNDVAMLWISLWMVLYLFHLCSKLAQMSLQPDKPQPRLHALFYPVWRGSPFGITPKTQYMLRPSLTDVATKQKCRDFISHHRNACHMHKIDQDCTSRYKQKDWMQKMLAFINLKTFLPDCMKNRRTDSPVTECRWSGRRHCQGQGWYPKWFN